MGPGYPVSNWEHSGMAAKVWVLAAGCLAVATHGMATAIFRPAEVTGGMAAWPGDLPFCRVLRGVLKGSIASRIGPGGGPQMVQLKRYALL